MADKRVALNGDGWILFLSNFDNYGEKSSGASSSEVHMKLDTTRFTSELCYMQQHQQCCMLTVNNFIAAVYNFDFTLHQFMSEKNLDHTASILKSSWFFPINQQRQFGK